MRIVRTPKFGDQSLSSQSLVDLFLIAPPTQVATIVGGGNKSNQMAFLLLRYILDNIVDERGGAFCG
jgi:hypothetical protein